MSSALIVKLKEARKAGEDPREAFEDWLHSRYKSNGLILIILFGLLLLFMSFLGAAAAAYVLKSDHPSVPFISALANMDIESLQWVIGLGLSLVLALLGLVLQMRNGRHKDLAAIYMVMAGGDIGQALKLTFEGKGGRGAAAMEVVSGLLGG